MERSEDIGFTLIELMVVVAIIGILASIAIPQYAAFRKRSYNTVALSDLTGAALAQEAYFVEFSTYSATTTSLRVSVSFEATPGVGFSVSSGTDTGYVMRSAHTMGDVTWRLEGPGNYITEE